MQIEPNGSGAILGSGWNYIRFGIDADELLPVLLVMETVLLPIAHCWHFWYSPIDAVIYAVFILFGKIVLHMVDFGVSMKTVAEINRLIRNRKRNG